MDVKVHKRSFEKIYKSKSYDTKHMRFPLADIDKFDWEHGRWGNEYYSYFHRKFSCHTLDRLDAREGQRILVAGCGVGSKEKILYALYKNI